MIKNIKFKNNNKSFLLNLDNPVNIIVGAKGMGKSTLLLLLAEAINNKKIFKDEYKWLIEKAGFNVESINIDNSDINSQDFGYIYETENKSNTKDNGVEFIQQKIPGFISQNDRRKDSLDSSEYVTKQVENLKKGFCEQIAFNEENKRELLPFIELFDDSQKYIKLQEKPLAFGTIFDDDFFLSSNNITSKIMTIDYSNSNEIKKIKELKSKFLDIADTIKKLNLRLNDVENNMSKNNDIYNIPEDELLEIKKYIEKHKETNKELWETLLKSWKIVKKNMDIISCFESELEFAKGKYIRELSKKNKFEVDKKDLLLYFMNMGSIIKEAKNKYRSIIEKDMEIKWNISEKDKKNSSISYRLNPFILTEEDKYMILNIMLGCSNKTNTISDIFLGRLKTDYNLKSIIEKIINGRIKIYAGDEEYKNLSTGQRTLFGITHTLKSLNNTKNEQYLLLDQIEDNLDNKTIYDVIVPLIQEHAKKGKQIFIVTHNPNIGTLIQGNTITADIFNEELDKKFILNKKISDKDTPQSLYLEGSMEAFNQRSKIYDEKIKGEK
ncbi:hypothetical protein [Mycoplasma elephantis]|uniref:hypothetical protein n=1 Tax=Mycoplasma elephantis TaxID=114882 RepID=UPI00048887C1|nr:hypothetical protein [Mycoplasma elephantis]